MTNMAMGHSLLVRISFTVFLFQSVYTLTQDEESCSTRDSCVSCTSKTTINQSYKCHWCTEDKKCYSEYSTDSKCGDKKNVTNPINCDYIEGEYSAKLAYRLVMLSAVAYSKKDQAEKYIKEALPDDTFTEITQVEETCPGKGVCAGFTAVSHSNEEIVVVMKGSDNKVQVVAQALSGLTECKTSFPAGGKVMAYYKEAFDIVWPDLKQALYSLVKKYPSYKVVVTGHSLGGGLASMAALSIFDDGEIANENMFLYTFGEPRVGNYEYATAHNNLKTSWRVVRYSDPIVHFPPCHETTLWSGCSATGDWPYHHGTEIFYDSKDAMTVDSSYKECTGLPANEDKQCSDSLSVWGQCFKTFLESPCTDYHNEYFGIDVGDWILERSLATHFKSSYFLCSLAFLVVMLFTSY